MLVAKRVMSNIELRDCNYCRNSKMGEELFAGVWCKKTKITHTWAMDGTYGDETLKQFWRL